MANTSKRFNWQVSFGVTHQLEYAELIEFYKKLPKMQQGAIGRRLMWAGLQALKKEGDPVISGIIGQENNNNQDAKKQLERKANKLNKRILGLLDS